MKPFDPMSYLPGMEILPDTDLMNEVLTCRSAYDERAYSVDSARATLEKERCTPEDFAALLSPAAASLLEEMAARAMTITRRHFGNSISMFTPLYIANYCENGCVYCGFNRSNRIRRARLAPEQMEEDLRTIARSGLEEILILTGESQRMSDVEYIAEACRRARQHFKLAGLEIYPVNTEQYALLHEAGADCVTVFQETYDIATYDRLHPAGPKRSFPYRFHAQERALRGGMRSVGFAALLGLDDFRKDALATGLHGWLLQRKYPAAEIAFSCPRIRPIVNSGGIVPREIGEAELLQVILAYRIFMPFASITISSRESARFRNHAVGMAATKISAGVSTGIGGHQQKAVNTGDEQFSIADPRTVDEIFRTMKDYGLQPVMNDYVQL
jgi:2-iminoacetate synthase